MVGIASVAKQQAGTFSLGMKQRLGLAAALIGDPAHLILDEPANGLDPEGIQWTRAFLSYLADQGRTVFVSSHLLGEMAVLADDLVVIGQGRLIDEGSMAEFVARYAPQVRVRVQSPQLDELSVLLRNAGASLSETMADALPAPRPEPGQPLAPPNPARRELLVQGVGPELIGDLAARHNIVLHLLAPITPSLEEAFFEVTRSSQEYTAGLPPVPQRSPLPPPVAPGGAS
jgi:ABC-2 type transport system ATP-binding protein